MLRNVTIVFVALVIAVGALAQSSRPQFDTFELASIKPVPVSRGGGIGGGVNPLFVCGGGPDRPQLDPGRFAVSRVTVYKLITMAYGMGNCIIVLGSGRIIGGPDWITSDKFAVEATIPQGSATYTVQQLSNGDAPQLQNMIRRLLAERFKLALHRETRILPTYNLTVAKGGPKLRSSQNGGCMNIDTSNGPASFPRPGTRTCGTRVLGTRGPNLTVDTTRLTLEEFAKALSLDLDRPVIDKTALTGLFDIHLEFARDVATSGVLPEGAVIVMGGPVMTSGSGPVEPAPSVFNALQEQLGLKLESAKGPVEVLVIDSVQHPSEN
jgi:uncharacterized protein (TIGR03435 family)